MDNYPETPGWKEDDGETSRAAAVAMADSAETLRARVFRLLQHGPRTTDEVADCMGVDRLAIRPRFTELKLQGKIMKTPARRCNVSGKAAAVWRVAGKLGQLDLLA